MAKIKIRIRENGPSERVQAWIEQNNIQFSSEGFADAPKAFWPDGDGHAHYNVPLDTTLELWHTLNSRNCYLDSNNPKEVKGTMVPFPIRSVEIKGEYIKIMRQRIVQGSEIAEILHETIYDGKFNNLPNELRLLVNSHTLRLREQMKLKQGKEKSTQKAESA